MTKTLMGKPIRGWGLTVRGRRLSLCIWGRMVEVNVLGLIVYLRLPR